MTIEITGRVIDRQTEEGVPGLQVELWLFDAQVDQPLAVAETREAGAFFAEMAEQLLQELRGTAIYFRVVHNGELVVSTEQSLVVRPDVSMLEITIEVDLLPAEQPFEPPVIELPRLPLVDLAPMESGLNYHGARYYVAWLGRWVSCDPQGLVEETNLYLYSRDNPLRNIDPTGKQAEKAEEAVNSRALHVIVVGTDDPGEPPARGGHNLADRKGGKTERKEGKPDDYSITKRVDTLINKNTELEEFPNRIGSEDRIIVYVSPSVDDQSYKELQEYGRAKYGERYEVKRVAEEDLAKEIATLSQIKTLVYFGHGIEEGPLYDWESAAGFPSASTFRSTQFTPDALALFETCNSWEYAKKFTAQTRVESIGVEGTTYYGVSEISRGLIDKDPKRPSIGHRFTYTPFSRSHVDDTKLNMHQKYGVPFLRTLDSPQQHK